MNQKLLLLLIFFTLSLQLDSCYVEKFGEYLKKHPDNNYQSFVRLGEVFMKTIRNSYGYTGHQFVATLQANFNYLPPLLKEAIRPCHNSPQSLETCEALYGKGECESNPTGMFEKRCPVGYLKEKANLCVKKCQENQKVISVLCVNNQMRYLDAVSHFNIKADCQNKYPFCDYNKSENSYLESCGLHEQRVGFMCLTRCYADFSQKEMELIAENPKYCLKEEIFVGSNVMEI